MATFVFLDKSYTYFTSPFNDTRHNERAIEIPIMLDITSKYKSKKILEIGNVMSNYYVFVHDILDKYDDKLDIIRQDILDFRPDNKYDLIFSISTFEHIGWDYGEDREIKKSSVALNYTKSLLADKGLLVITAPLGFNDEFDSMIKNGEISFTKCYCMKRGDYNDWNNTNLDNIWNTDYSREACNVGMLTKDRYAIVKYTTHLIIGFYWKWGWEDESL